MATHEPSRLRDQLIVCAAQRYAQTVVTDELGRQRAEAFSNGFAGCGTNIDAPAPACAPKLRIDVFEVFVVIEIEFDCSKIQSEFGDREASPVIERARAASSCR